MGRTSPRSRFRNHVDANTVTITLTWNDYREEEDAGTDKDLDLFVEDWAGHRIGSGEKAQVSGSRVAGAEESRNPRERVVLTGLAASPEGIADPDYCYRIRVRAKRGPFAATDRLRVLVTSARDAYLPPGGDAPREAVEFLDATGSGEIYPPADGRLVLTVGDSDPSSSIGPTADGRAKPEVVLDDSRAYFTDGEVSSGSSDAAAYVAGAAASVSSEAAAPGLPQPRRPPPPRPPRPARPRPRCPIPDPGPPRPHFDGTPPLADPQPRPARRGAPRHPRNPGTISGGS